MQWAGNQTFWNESSVGANNSGDKEHIATAQLWKKQQCRAERAWVPASITLVTVYYILVSSGS